MSKMHELLAVESDIQGTFKVATDEIKKVFNDKAAIFQGFNRRLIPFDDSDKTAYPEENQVMTTTVDEKLDYYANYVTKLFDVMIQKETTNQTAVADLVVGDKVLATNVPATCLLGLETRLKEVRAVYADIPTLQVGIDWELAEDIGKGVFKMRYPEERLRTEQKFKSQVLYEATQHHPAQVEKWQEQVPTGKFVKKVWCGMITPGRKSELLGRIDTLIRAVKKARQRANMADVPKVNIGKVLMNFIHE